MVSCTVAASANCCEILAAHMQPIELASQGIVSTTFAGCLAFFEVTKETREARTKEA